MQFNFINYYILHNSDSRSIFALAIVLNDKNTKIMVTVELTEYQVWFLIRALSPYFEEEKCDRDFILHLVNSLSKDF